MNAVMKQIFQYEYQSQIYVLLHLIIQRKTSKLFVYFHFLRICEQKEILIVNIVVLKILLQITFQLIQLVLTFISIEQQHFFFLFFSEFSMILRFLTLKLSTYIDDVTPMNIVRNI